MKPNNHYFFMNNKALLFLILLLAWQASAQSIGIAVASPTTTTAFSCLVDQNNSIVIVRVYKANDTYQGVDPDGYQNLINANAAHSRPSFANNVAGFRVDAYMEPCRSSSDPATQVQEMLSDSPSRLYKTLFVKVEPCPHPDCSWESFTHQENCDFLNDLLGHIHARARRLRVGVFSTAKIWTEFFGNTCDSIGVAYPTLWYGVYGVNGELLSAHNFGDFVSFGGWTVPYLKQTYGNTTVTNLCGNEWFVYLDRVYSASAI